MQYIVYISIYQFYVRELQRLQPTDCARVVMREGRVLDANDLALASGILVGMSEGETKTVLDGGGEIIEFRQEEFERARETWLNVCAKFTDVIEPRLPHEAFLDLSSHPRPSEVLSLLRRALEKRLELSVVVGVSQCRWVAELAAKRNDADKLAYFSPQMFVAHEPTAMLSEVRPEIRSQLTFLGYRKIGEVAEIDRNVLLQQFGEIGHSVFDAARGMGDAVVHPRYPKNAIAVSKQFDGAPENWEEFWNLICLLADQLGGQLEAKGLCGRQLTLVYEFANGGRRRISRSFIKSFFHPLTVRCAIKLMTQKFPEHPVERIRLIATEVEPSDGIQMGLEGMKSRRERVRSVHSAVQSLQQVFGDKVIERASEMPQERRSKVLSAWREVYGWH